MCPPRAEGFRLGRATSPSCALARADASLAGCKTTRKGTSAAMFFVGTHLVGEFSRTQSVISLSSGESEYYALVVAAGALAARRDVPQLHEPRPVRHGGAKCEVHASCSAELEDGAGVPASARNLRFGALGGRRGG